jgi:Arc/MetJ family transcription regulator
MRTNIIIDDALMRLAMQASGTRSKREAVELSLCTLVRLQQQGRFALTGVRCSGRVTWRRSGLMPICIQPLQLI